MAINLYKVGSMITRSFSKFLMARNRGQSAADVADATRAAFHLTASAHPTKIKHQKMSEITFYKALDRLSTADFYFKSKKRKASSGRFFEIERVVSKRVKKGKVSDCFDTAFVRHNRVQS